MLFGYLLEFFFRSVKYFFILTYEAKQLESIFLKFSVVYGITTGFGKFARTTIEKDKLMQV